MSFPPIGVTVPSLSDWQYSFNGLVMGAAESWAVLSSDGLDLPSMRTGDIARPRDRGSFTGLDVIGDRDITLEMYTQASSSAALQALTSTLVAATVPGGTTETPLWFKRPGYPLLASMVRVRKRALKSDSSLAFSHIAKPVMMFHATDPCLYAAPLSVTDTLPAPSGGFHFPLTFPLTFGTGGGSGVVSVVNSGNVETRPILLFTGPVTNPAAQNFSAPGQPKLSFNITLNAGDTLAVDTDIGSIIYTVNGSLAGASRRAALVFGSKWWTLAPGANMIAFSSTDVVQAAGTLAIQSASAYMGVL